MSLSSDRGNNASLAANEEDIAKLPLNLRKLFQTPLSLVKSCALQVKANMMLREDELSQIREQATYQEEQLSDQAKKYIDLQNTMQATIADFDQFKER